MSGRFLRQKHGCYPPVIGSVSGEVWECDCGKRWIRSYVWQAWRRDRLPRFLRSL